MTPTVVRITIVAAVVFIVSSPLKADGDIGSETITDTLPPEKLPADLTLTPERRGKAEALTFFSQAYLTLKDTKAFSPEVIEMLLKVVEHDPVANLPLNLLMTGWAAEGKQRHEKLVNRLLPIARAHPEAARLNLVTVFALMKLERLDDGVTLLENALVFFKSKEELDSSETPVMIDLSLALAGLYERRGDFADGDDIFEELFDDPARDDDLKILEAASLFYNMASEKASDSSWIWFVDSDKVRYARKRAETFDALTRVCATKKMTMSELAGVLDLFRKEKRFDEALAMVLNNVLRDPGNSGALVLLAALYHDSGQSGKSYRVWRRLVDRESNDEKREFYHLEMGRAALTAGYHELAVSAFEWYLMLNPKDQLAVYQLGLACFELRDYQKAMRKFKDVDNIPQAKYFLSLCLRFLGDYDAAVEAMEAARKIAEKNKDEKFKDKSFALTYAYICEKAGALNKMSHSLLKLLEENPDDAETANFLGYVWADHDMNLSKARALIERALKVEPNNSAYLDSMAWVMYRQGEFERAAEFIEKSLANEGEMPDAVILDHAGDIRHALGDDEKALNYWRRALGIYSEEVTPESIQKKIDALREKKSTPPAR